VAATNRARKLFLVRELEGDIEVGVKASFLETSVKTTITAADIEFFKVRMRI
jgi:hypothetical protein